ncbi:MAG: hypothetical protein HOP30_15360 [Cyclobacteriaceae bacterium]|nr:hypothetical protein [Cyclobacteriaceae bacterium]
MKKEIFSILLTTVWISISEFVRNSFLLHENWISHYRGLGMSFPEQPINGAVWGIWSLSFAIVIYILHLRFSFLQTIVLSWLVGFVLMWLVVGNLGVLPFSILPFAIPLSLLEVFVAGFIIKKFSSSNAK